MKPERHEDWLRLAAEDRDHYVIGKDGSINHVPDQGLFSGLIDRIRESKKCSKFESAIMDLSEKFVSDVDSGAFSEGFRELARVYLHKLWVAAENILRSNLSRRQKQRLNSLVDDAYRKCEIVTAMYATLFHPHPALPESIIEAELRERNSRDLPYNPLEDKI